MLDTIVAVAPFVSLIAATVALGLSWLQSAFIKAATGNPAEFAAYTICELEDDFVVELLGAVVQCRKLYGGPIPLQEAPELRD